ncbi:ABC transporter transmembrane domain-containing protein [Sulfitobacter sp. D35]|uniref:ABC transporter transmembrane domain-containing protein n=1 Tax=Sulfitobacter sp. D35 TaxID=3083252 RepID=UPI00296F4EC3|nr:ABC transporter transmembrane domain-containing protein [Sulfitobacter sp. D35]MDW4497129.1 ABC transporter transmembrane domain-containing protein [Sulfitobacter sp. D35]
MFELYRAIWTISGRRQIVLIVLSAMIAALAAAPLKFQQEIINHLADGTAEAGRLFLLGGGMMAVVVLSLGLKWVAGYRSQVLGEDVIRLIRTRLIARASDGVAESSDVRTGALTTAVSSEAEDLGKFAGDALAAPVLQIGTLISVIAFIAATQPRLGLIAVSIIVPQVILVLMTQRKVNTLVAERIRILRAATDQITARNVASAATSITAEFDEIFALRKSMFRWKLSTKFLLSLINGAGVVGVLMLGGWLVLKGQSDVGTVVAATVGLGRLQGPTTFLIAFYRQVSANRVKFELLRSLVLFRPAEPASGPATSAP